jgi:hypothetical protein
LGQAQQISVDASSLAGYNSPHDTRTVEGQKEEPPEENLQEFRGVSQKDQLIHSIISWATLESYPLRIGVSLPVVAQFWWMAKKFFMRPNCGKRRKSSG